MSLKSVFIILFLSSVVFCESLQHNAVESRGKKKKIAIFVYIADLILKKFFVLKLIYAFVFWVLLHKAGYFLTWFANYLKEQKEEEHHHPHYDYHPSYPSYGPYRRQNYGAR